jgi:MFS transporter, NRE family, putaive nickel resistance protein
VPTQTLLADLIAPEFQGRVYGAHFAWSHLWWVLAYPLAGWLGRGQLLSEPTPPRFLIGAGLALGVLLLVQLGLSPKAPSLVAAPEQVLEQKGRESD